MKTGKIYSTNSALIWSLKLNPARFFPWSRSAKQINSPLLLHASLISKDIVNKTFTYRNLLYNNRTLGLFGHWIIPLSTKRGDHNRRSQSFTLKLNKMILNVTFLYIFTNNQIAYRTNVWVKVKWSLLKIIYMTDIIWQRQKIKIDWFVVKYLIRQRSQLCEMNKVIALFAFGLVHPRS